jgi:Tfp pilus assembly protein, tip-associated adhesin PilY1
MKKICSHIGWLILVIFISFFLSSNGTASDEELFTTSANPNVLLVIDQSASMSTQDPSVLTGSIGNLDGNGSGDTRMDILYKVVYTLLNADMSIPGGSTDYTLALLSTIPTGALTCNSNSPNTSSACAVQVSCGGSYSTFPSNTTSVRVGSGANEDTFSYSSKYSSSGKCYLWVPKNTVFLHQHLKQDSELVHYTVTTSFTTSYPTQTSHVSGTDAAAYDNNITVLDQQALKARIGLMKLTPATDYANNIMQQIPSGASNDPIQFNPTYRGIWTSLKTLTPSDATPTRKTLDAAWNFFDTCYNATDNCRKNYIVMITDGEDTVGTTSFTGLPQYYRSPLFPYSYDYNYHAGWSFNADGWSGSTGQVARNNGVISEAARLSTRDARMNIQLYTVGVGIGADQPANRALRDVLRRAAEQKGITTDDYSAIGNRTTAEDTSIAAGKAFFGTDATEIASSLHDIFQQITKGTFSFTAPTVLSVRSVDRNEVYSASFEPAIAPTTLWKGHLKSFKLIDNNTILWWDAGEKLQTRDVADRNIFTSDNTWTRKSFDTSSITPIDLGFPVDNTTTRSSRDAIVDYVRGVGHDNNWKMGDIFHSKPVLVGAPSRFYIDQGYQPFAALKADRRRVVYVGANDGTLHAFMAGDWDNTTGKYDNTTDTGAELFAYVPFTLLPEINKFRPTITSGHEYYVDSSPRVADVWWNDNNNIGVKQSSEWHTVLVSGMRKGGNGYFALDITSPPKSSTYTDANYPKVLWEVNSDTLQLGETWSESLIAKVRVAADGNINTPMVDRFVAVFGGGKSSSGTVGNSLFVVDVKTGAVLRQFTGLDNEVVASPTAVLDYAGYIRFIYVTDLSGNVWKFDFQAVGLASTGYSEWTPHKIFTPASTGRQPAYNRVEAATANASGSLRYLYFGTGDREAPLTNSSAGKFYMVIDDDSNSAITESQLLPVANSIASASGGALGNNKGWVLSLSAIPLNSNDNFTHAGEKVLSDPVIFFNRVYFTTYTPLTTNPCSGGGISRLYGLDWFSAAAGMAPITGVPYNETGTVVPTHVFSSSGLASSPSLSLNPYGQSTLFIGFSDGTYKEMSVASPSTRKKLRSWQEIN